MSFLSFIKNSLFPNYSYNYHNKHIAMYLKHLSVTLLSLSLPFASLPPSISFEPQFTPVTEQTSSVPGFFHLWTTARFVQTSFPSPGPSPGPSPSPSPGPSPGPPSSPSLQVIKSWADLGTIIFARNFSSSSCTHQLAFCYMQTPAGDLRKKGPFNSSCC